MSAPACHAPFVSMELDPAGNAYTCCANQLYPLGHVADASLAEIWAGPRAQALRAALAAGDLSLGCNSCRWADEHGNDQTIARLYDAFPVPEPSPVRPSRMTFALSNRCNLECVMCNGELSSRIRAREGRPPLPAAYGEEFFVQLDEWLPGLVQASFLGGEPFLIAENYRIWDRLAVVNPGVRAAVVTNATRYDARVEAVLGALAFDVTVSLDGLTPATVEAIRRNLDVAEALEHARRFREHTRRVGTAFGFNFCLTPHNWQELGPFLAFADGWDADVRVISVSEPGHCLHDLDADALAGVLAAWEGEAPRWERELGRNRHAWDVEVEQVRRTLAERRAGVAPTLRQPAPVDGPLVERPSGPAAVAVGERAVARLHRWAAGGPVARLVLGADGRVAGAAVEGVGGALAGLDPTAAVGAHVDDVVRGCEAAAGRALHVLERDDEPGVVDRTLLATDGPPVRGAVGAVLRVVVLGDDGGGATVHVAADRYYDRPDRRDAPVAVRGRG